MHPKTLFVALTLGATMAHLGHRPWKNPVATLHAEPMSVEINIEVQYRVF
jgi:hypothetical protein